MIDQPTLARVLNLLSRQPPHVADYNRRQFLRSIGTLGLSATALTALTEALSVSEVVAANPPVLPEITSIPEKLKGSGSVRVCSYGGAFQDAQRKAYFEPFERLSGIKVIESQGPDPVKVKVMVDTKNIEYDVGEFDRGSVLNLQKNGDYWEEIDYSLVDVDNIEKAFQYKYALDMLPYAQIFAYRSDVFKDSKPDGWADFWDTSKFPGPRTMPGSAGGVTADLEAATMASGVPMDKVYPIDIDKAYASLTKIKPAIVKWWTAGALPAQMLNDKEAVMATAWNGRIAAIQATGAPVEIAWRQGTLRKDAWAVLKGSPNRENAMKFTAFITMPLPQARLSMLIPYGFVNNKAVEYLPAERLKALPTAPEIKKQLLLFNSEWWADNRDKVIERWPSWLLQ